MVSRRTTLAAATLLALGAGAAKADEARARLVDAGVIGGKRYAAIVIDLPPHAVTYWRNPGDGGVAPEFDAAGSDNVAAATLRFPAPRRFDKAGATAFGYEGRVVLPVEISAKDPARPARLTARFDYGVCAELCVPAQERFELSLPASGAGDPQGRADAEAALAQVPRLAPPGDAGAPAVLSARAAGGGRFEVATRGGTALFVEAPEGWWFDVEGAGPGFTLVLAQKPAGATGPTPATLTVTGPEGAVETPLALDVGDAAP